VASSSAVVAGSASAAAPLEKTSPLENSKLRPPSTIDTAQGPALGNCNGMLV